MVLLLWELFGDFLTLEVYRERDCQKEVGSARKAYTDGGLRTGRTPDFEGGNEKMGRRS